MESGFWNPLSVFGIPHQTGNLASPCKIPLRIWHPMQKFYSHIQASLLLWHSYVRVQYNNHLKQLLQLYRSSSAGNCSRPAHLKWNQFCHTWPYHHMFLACDKQQFNLHTGEVGLVMGAPALVCGKGIIVFLWKHLNTCCLVLERSKFSPTTSSRDVDPRISDVGGS